MKHYTFKQAQKEVGKSKSYRVALEVSIKKWEEISKYGTRYYQIMSDCGYCLVRKNRGCLCDGCPPREICGTVTTPMLKSEISEVLRKLRERKKK